MDAGVNWVNDQCILVVYLGPGHIRRIWCFSLNLMTLSLKGNSWDDGMMRGFLECQCSLKTCTHGRCYAPHRVGGGGERSWTTLQKLPWRYALNTIFLGQGSSITLRILKKGLWPSRNEYTCSGTSKTQKFLHKSEHIGIIERAILLALHCTVTQISELILAPEKLPSGKGSSSHHHLSNDKNSSLHGLFVLMTSQLNHAFAPAVSRLTKK